MRKLESILAERAHLDADDRDLRSRTDDKEERVAIEEGLSKLSAELVQTKDSWLIQLDLSESLQDAIHDAQKIKSPIAKNRQMRIVRRELRSTDWQRIHKALQVLSAHGALPSVGPDPTQSTVATWVKRLLAQGNDALSAFLEEFPNADRTQLRQLIRNIEKAPKDKRAKAESKLTDAVAEFLFPHPG
jgi:ribosome-associated protein